MGARRLLTLFGAVGLVPGSLLIPAVRPALADSGLPASFEAVATADTVRVATNVPGAPLSDGVLEMSSGSAEARIDGLGVSRAFAAAPYPGPTTTNLFDVLRGATGVPIPSYPLIAASDHPGTPEATVAMPALNLSARSQPTASEAGLAMGADGGDGAGIIRNRGRTHVSVDESGAVLAEAATETAGIVVGPVAFSKVTSQARVLRTAGGEPHREQTVDVTGLTIGGQTVGIGPQGLVTPVTNTPLPETHPIRQALQENGVTVHYVDGVSDPDGVISAGLIITQVVPASPTGAPSTVTYNIGRASARVVIGTASSPEAVASPFPLNDDDGSSSMDTLLPAEGSPAVPPTAEGAVSFSGSLTTDSGSLMTPPGEGVAGVDESVPADTVDVPSPETASGAPRQPADPVNPPLAASAASIAPASQAWSIGLYLAVLLSGGALLAAFLVVRGMGVKRTWAS